LEVLRERIKANADFSDSEAVETALARRLDLANSADAITDAERKVLVAADGLKGDLNLFGRMRPVSREGGDVSLLKRWEDVFEVGADVDLPLDRVAERNIFRQALIALNQRQREYELGVDTVKLEIRQSYRDLMEAGERYRLQLESAELAKKRFDEASLLVQYSRASSRRVLNAQDDLFNAENDAMQALVDYAIANLNFYRDTGVLQARSDGMWGL
jgi:outer membrane protein TolC